MTLGMLEMPTKTAKCRRVADGDADGSLELSLSSMPTVNSLFLNQPRKKIIRSRYERVRRKRKEKIYIRNREPSASALSSNEPKLTVGKPSALNLTPPIGSRRQPSATVGTVDLGESHA